MWGAVLVGFDAQPWPKAPSLMDGMCGIGKCSSGPYWSVTRRLIRVDESICGGTILPCFQVRVKDEP